MVDNNFLYEQKEGENKGKRREIKTKFSSLKIRRKWKKINFLLKKDF